MTGEQKPFSRYDTLALDRLQFALQAAHVGTWDIDLVNQQVWWDDHCQELFGISGANQVPFAQVLTMVHPADQLRVGQAVQRAIDQEENGRYDIMHRANSVDGSERWLHCRGKAYVNEQGLPYRLAGTVADVTEQVLARQQVDASEARLRFIVASAPIAIALFTGEELVIDLPNQTFIDTIGKGPDIAGKPLRQLMPELENQPILQTLSDVYTSGTLHQSFGTPVDVVQQGVLRHNFYDITYTPIQNAVGHTYAVLNISVDVTEQVLARQKIAEAEERFRGAIELAELGTWEVDLSTAEFCFSDRLKAWYGLRPHESVTGEHVYLAVREADRARLWAAASDIISQASPNRLYDVEYTIDAARTGRERILRAQGNVFVDASGRPTRISGTVQDVTEQRWVQLALEREVQERTEELAVMNRELMTTNEEFMVVNHALEEANNDLVRSNQNLEQFAYIASHDLQEPLRKIQQFGDLLKIRYADSAGDELDFLNRMQSAAGRMSILIRDLLAFSRISTRQASLTPVALRQAVEQALDNLSVSIAETKAQIDIHDLPVIPGDSLQLSQLFQNLLSNAIKFSRPGVTPHVVISSHPVQARELPPSIKPTRLAAAYHRVEVADNGIGFDEKYTDRIFQVFQRLHGKNEFAGTGVGLAICEKVAVNHGGGITASSQSGQGATFSVYLPVSE
ncbi:PAS domain-containing sensor histidine kinase [Spirosoma sordidisoli]|uniref:histidine kinase n=1 Tax=Spirosoma sordidisoli TaxID=2502893 RepID=A0A4Q2UFI5_9BACT|nr:ATP-binding protein [Spirosoma sordidisoli]RYC67844.1 PAS domain S-box protein [Spirosoma sordidisoli]